ncbi:oligosaccharide flippase family protein [Sphingosinicella sp. BN140058]|uniref:oligosaccharide flippase family protein n=1 Tax=Sphingosinicella sp. BN140058 TaxID=1892855 RepID=UPI0013EAACF8|nr:oligosaccharide flippase family protein [Sphingosinicella sp. BN140058]
MTIDRATLYRSAFLAVTMQWGVRAIGLVSVITLARLLQPSDFGVVAIALSAAAFVELFGWIGLRQALLRVPDPDRSHYDTAWTIQLILFMLLAVAMLAIAPLAASFYKIPAVTGILCVMSLRMVALAVSNIGIVDFERDMTFGRDMAMRLGVRVASLLVSLVAAFTLRNYWALVIGMVAQSIFWMIGTYVAHPYRPRLSLARRAEILGVSLWMFVSTFSEWVQSQIERLVLGRFVLPATVGLYSVSKDLSSIFTQEIATALNRVTFVTVARSEANGSTNVATVIGAYAAIVAPLAAGLVATAPDTIAVLLGAKWLPAAPLMRIIALYTGVQAVSLMVASVFQASGQARRAATLNIAGAFLSAAGIGTAAFFFRRPEAVAVAALCVNATMLTIGIVLLAMDAKTSAVSLAANLLRPLFAAAAMAFVLMRLLSVETGHPLPDLLVEVAVGAVVYGTSLFFLWFASGRPGGAEQEAALLIGGLTRRLAPGR